MENILILGAVTAVVLFVGIGIYNRLVAIRNQVERAWANIDVILKQRFEEIPQLIQVVEQTAQYEGTLLQSLAQARQKYGAQSASTEDKIKASQEMAIALKGVFALAEAYPTLKANDSFKQLQDRISGLENTLADRREIYNENVSIFNTRIEVFPDTIVAGLMNYRRQTMFAVQDAERAMPSVKMNLPDFRKGA